MPGISSPTAIPCNDETAKTIADKINNGRKIPAGWIPLGTPNYTYRSRA